MTRRLLTPLVLAALTLSPLPPARAHGLGVHAGVGSGDSTHTQVGITWDTCVARDHAFSYRLTVARETFELRRDGWQERLSGTLIEHTFGLQLTASDRVRWWMGPQALVALYEEDLGTGFGLGLGANWHVAEALSVGLTAGGRWMLYSGVFGEDEGEGVGYLRVDLLWRAPGDRPPR